MPYCMQNFKVELAELFYRMLCFLSGLSGEKCKPVLKSRLSVCIMLSKTSPTNCETY